MARRPLQERLTRAAAEQAENAYEFWTAARQYREVAQRETDDPEAVAFAHMQSARALQKAQNWRTQVAHWEELGNELGRRIADPVEARDEGRYKHDAARGDAVNFGVIGDAEWRAVKTTYGDLDQARRHQQAWVYQWAAEVAESHDENVAAARLFRRAGVSWEKSSHKESWRRAATCYAQAAINAAKTSRHFTRRGIHDCAWCPSCLRDKSQEEKCKHPQQPRYLARDGEGMGTDIDRLSRCWMKVANRESPDNRETLTGACRQFTAIQRQLSVSGSREDAIAVFRGLHKFRRRFFRKTGRLLPFAASALGKATWGNGSSLRNLLLTIVVLYAGVFPFLWYQFDVILEEPRIERTILFSLANMANTAGDHFGELTWVATYFQVLQALSGFVALGLTLWISQRSYA